MGFKAKVSYEDKSEEWINDYVRKFAKIVFATQSRARFYAPKYIGNLTKQIIVLVHGDNKYEIVSNANYSKPMEYGTKPYTAPIGPLLEWGEKKLGSKSIGAAVWQKIRKEGITPHPFMTPAREFARKELIKLFREISE